jgi:hypothetical protein
MCRRCGEKFFRSVAEGWPLNMGCTFQQSEKFLYCLVKIAKIALAYIGGIRSFESDSMLVCPHLCARPF